MIRYRLFSSPTSPLLSSRDQRGQAMTEFVIWVFVLLLMISGILFFGKSYELKLKAHMASRYIAWQHAQTAETDMQTPEILERATKYYPLSDGNPTFEDVSPVGIFSPGVLNEGGPMASGFDLFSSMDSMFNTSTNDAGWEATTVYNPDGILDQTLPGGATIRSRHFVSGGSWHKRQIEGDEVIFVAKTGLMAWSFGAL